MKKSLLLLLLIFTWSIVGYSQSTQFRALAYYKKAKASFENNQYTESIKYAYKSKDALKSTNRSLQYLLTVSNVEIKNWILAEQEFKTFFKIEEDGLSYAPDFDSTKFDTYMNEMMDVMVDIEDNIAELNKSGGYNITASKEIEKIYKLKDVETRPVYPGCSVNETELNNKKCFKNKIISHIKKHFTYPAYAKQGGVEGTVGISFVISKNGSIRDVEIVKSVEYNLDNEAVRIVSLIPKMEVPATIKGNPVSVSISLPITFRLHANKGKLVASNTVIKKDNTKIILDNKSDLINTTELIEEEKKEVFNFQVVESKPIYPGCENIPTKQEQSICFSRSMMKHVKENFSYPEIAKKMGVQGRVIVSFVIWKDGSIRDIKVLRGVDKNLDREAVRIVSKIPNMKPAIQRGKPVPVSFMLPITFRLQ